LPRSRPDEYGPAVAADDSATATRLAERSEGEQQGRGREQVEKTAADRTRRKSIRPEQQQGQVSAVIQLLRYVIRAVFVLFFE